MSEETVCCPFCGGTGEVDVEAQAPDHRPLWVALAVMVMLLEETDENEMLLRSDVRDHVTVQLGLPTAPKHRLIDGEPTGPSTGRQDTQIVTTAIVQLEKWGLVERDEEYVGLTSHSRAKRWVTTTRGTIARQALEDLVEA